MGDNSNVLNIRNNIMNNPGSETHPTGEQNNSQKSTISTAIDAVSRFCEIDTFAGKLFVDWDHDAQVTPAGQLSFFIHFLKLGGQFEDWVKQAPLHYTSNNAPAKVDVLGSFVLSILSGHRRYAHIGMLKSDTVSAGLFGMEKIVSDDSALRALRRMKEKETIPWMRNGLLGSCIGLLEHAWICDVDVTVKPLYGHQEGAVLGYNPHKPGRPSHTYHSYLVANLRLVLEVEVQAGNQSASSYSAPGLMTLLERIPEDRWPEFVRGDCDWGSGPIMNGLEEVGMCYLFKLKKTQHVKNLISQYHCNSGWQRFNDDWEAVDARLSLSTWQQERRVVIVRRRVAKGDPTPAPDMAIPYQHSLPSIEGPEDIRHFEYAVLVTTLETETIAIVQHYRDRADCENVFDELKNQWGWGGYTTMDLNPCQIMARMIALIYNWWSLFVRLINPTSHWEASTSRPLLLSSVGKMTRQSRQTKLTLTSRHAHPEQIQAALENTAAYFNELKRSAPQLTVDQLWTRIVNKAVEKVLPSRGPGPPLSLVCAY